MDLPAAVLQIVPDGPATLVVDQLDTVVGTERGIACVQLLRFAASINGMHVLAVSRGYEAERVQEIRSLPFARLICGYLPEEIARDSLVSLGIDEKSFRMWTFGAPGTSMM